MKANSRNSYNWRTNRIKQRSRLSLMQSLTRSLRVYCENTGLHGFRYIVTGRTTAEKLIWLVICLSAIIFCVMLMLLLWSHFTDNPTVTIIDTSNPIKDLPFPGITICNNNKVYKPRAEVVARKLMMNGFDVNMSNKLFSSLMKLIRPDKIEIDNATASWALDILDYTVDKLMFQLMQPCSSLLVRCSWLGQLYDCDKMFKTVKSNEGFCCGFNYHFHLSQNYDNKNSWLMNITDKRENVQEYNSSESLPGVGNILHAPGTGRDVGLAVALNVDAKNYKSSVRQFVGATVLTHDPTDYPDIGAQPSSLLAGHVMTITLAGTRITSSKDIQNIPLHKRMCLFDGETSGEQNYSYQTCISECTQQKVYGFCGCLPFFYPHEHPDVRTCYLTDVDCILARRSSLSQVQLSRINDCNCLPQCNDKSYEVVTESVRIDNIEYDSEITRGLSENTSFLYVYFRDGTYLEYRKQTILGWDTLLASFGGIFGLCLGGSILSFVEFLYYLISDNLKSHEEKREQSNKNLPPASELFVSVPVTERSVRNNKETIENHMVFAWKGHLYQRNQKSTVGFKGNRFSPFIE